MKLLLIAASVFYSANVLAYLDPGTGSMLLQVLLGGFAAVGVAMKLYWHNIMAFFGKGSKELPQDPENDS